MVGVDLGLDAHAGTQLGIARLAVDADAHRNALHHLHPVAAEVFCAGSTENSEPLFGAMLSTSPFQMRPG